MFQHLDILLDICKAKKIDPRIIACIIIQESNCNQYAWRWEEKFYNNKLKDMNNLAGWTPKSSDTLSLVDEKLQRSCSYGYMQILGETARWLNKFKEPYLGALFDPRTNIDLGTDIIMHYTKISGGSLSKGLKKYNGSTEYAVKVIDRFKKQEYKKLGL